jgi:2-keto-4-pentenoate hydratase
MSAPSRDTLVAAALALREARATRRPIGRISESHGIAGLEAAYAVAEINTRAQVESGRRVIGRKVGLTSKAVQTQLGVDQPDFGLLFDDMEFLHGQELPAGRLLQPKAEAEVAFVVGRDLDTPAPSYSEFVASLAYALPALEIVDSAITDWKITLVDTVADNASCGVYVLGDQPVPVGALQLAEIGMQLDKNGQTASVGSGAACLGHPLRAAYWLAQTMGRLGQGLKAGEVILSGALGPMVPIAPGDRIDARLGALGNISCRLATEGASQ